MNIKLQITLFVLIALIGCRGKEMNHLEAYSQRFKSVPQEKWDLLAQKKFYFGHQSVGQNIIDSLEKVMSSSPMVHLNVVETLSSEDFGQPLFAHSRIGQNRNPKGKIDHFRKILENGIGQAADVAFFKFCFIDVVKTTDVESLINYYDETVASLRTKFPQLRIITVTVPLTNAPKNPKARIKRILGMGPPIEADNIKRNIMNAHLRQRYSNATWDLANIEASGAGGKKASFQDGGQTYLLLNPSYTYDGGHLNAIGSQAVAMDLLLYLLSIDFE